MLISTYSIGSDTFAVGVVLDGVNCLCCVPVDFDVLGMTTILVKPVSQITDVEHCGDTCSLESGVCLV